MDTRSLSSRTEPGGAERKWGEVGRGVCVGFRATRREVAGVFGFVALTTRKASFGHPEIAPPP
jgi:hypothetical protein